jgi:CubicO group peptidase (beta-lactamase class C family)
MRALGFLLVVAACHSAPAPAPPAPPPDPAPAPAPVATAPAAPVAKPETLAADTPRTTVGGAAFIAPAEWTLSVRGPATILEAPEQGSRIALIDVAGKDADAAIALAWAAYQKEKPRPVQVATALPDRDGWTNGKRVVYETSPNEKRGVVAIARRGGELWTVILFDVLDAVQEKRSSQIGLMLGRLLPKGRQRESFAGKPAATLDAARIAALGKFVDDAREPFGVPAIAIGLIQDGKVVFAGGFGQRDLGKPARPDADTLFMIASNTKALTTLLLAKLVDANKLTWETPVTQLMPKFKLGDAETTRSVLVKHLICACTGLPRQDLEWLLEYGKMTPAIALAELGEMQPTSKFGALFQYSNPLAAAAGFVAGAVAYPGKELGAAYDAAMQAQVFAPLGMTATTFDFKRALRANHAGAYSLDIDGKPAAALMNVNYAVIPLRPAGGAWSSIRDMLKYVQMELATGALPGGKRYISEAALLARRAPQVAMSKDQSYGMGLMVDRTWGIPVVHHGGDLIGFHSDMIWLPDHKVGAVILTNSDGGVLVRDAFRRKLLEILFDGEPLADAQLAAAAAQFKAEIAAERARLTVPADPADVAKLAARYHNAALGDVAVLRTKAGAAIDVGEWKSEIATRHAPDGTVSLVTTAPGIGGFELVVGSADGKRTLVLRDGQHEYVFTEP